MSYEFNRSYSLLFFTLSTVIFFINIIAISVDEWTIIDDQKKGLWRNTTVQEAPEFNGLEVMRGVMVVTLVLTFLFWLFSLFNILRNSNYYKFKNFKYSNAFVIANAVAAIYNFLSALIFTTFIDGKYHVLSSQYLVWASFGLSAAQFIVASVVKFSVKPGENRVAVHEVSGNSSYPLENCEKIDPSGSYGTENPAYIGQNPGEQSESQFSDSSNNSQKVKKVTTVKASDENQDRGNWDNQFEYLLSMIGYAVGLGNVWRFPYLCYENGGGAFIIPYVIMLFLAGIPIFFMEVSIAQFSSYGPIKLWNICPGFRGLGYMMVMYSAWVALYYNTIIGYSIFYFFSTLASKVPWQNCFGWIYEPYACTVNGTISELRNETDKHFTPAELYYKEHMQQYVPMNDKKAWEIVWQIVVCLFLAWTIVYFVIIRGIKSSGKVAIFAALFPYVILIALFIRGVTLEGASDGISYYIGKDSDFSKLSDMNVWRRAATQIFFSLSAGWGGLHALSSYNTFHNSMVRDTIMITCINCATSIFAGFAIFSILGNMAFTLNVSVTEVVNGGFGLAFIAYPDALSKIPGSTLWCAIFFLMLFTLGLDSEMTTMETVITGLVDVFPDYLKPRRAKLIGAISMTLFILGLCTCTRTGQNWVSVFDDNTSSWGLLLTTTIEVILVGTWYGGGVPGWLGYREERLIEDIEIMIGKKSNLFWFPWRCLWYVITPVLLLGLLFCAIFLPETETDQQKIDLIGKTYLATVVGWLVVCSGLIFIPIIFAKKFINNNFDWRKCMYPNRQWGPYLAKHRVGTRYERPGDDPMKSGPMFGSNNSSSSASDAQVKLQVPHFQDGISVQPVASPMVAVCQSIDPNPSRVNHDNVEKCGIASINRSFATNVSDEKSNQ